MSHVWTAHKTLKFIGIKLNKTSWMIAVSEYPATGIWTTKVQQTNEGKKDNVSLARSPQPIFRALITAVCACAPVAVRHAEYLNVFWATRSDRQWRCKDSSYTQQGWESLKLFKSRQNPDLVTFQSVKEKASLSVESPGSTDANLFSFWPFKMSFLLERTSLQNYHTTGYDRV